VACATFFERIAPGVMARATFLSMRLKCPSCGERLRGQELRIG